jgi:REP element-mobilizing transposase RayT
LLRQRALLSNAHRRELFLKVLENVRRRYQWVVIGYVVMPEHVHLLVSEPQQRPLTTAIQALKLGFSRRLLAGCPTHSWFSNVWEIDRQFLRDEWVVTEVDSHSFQRQE